MKPDRAVKAVEDMWRKATQGDNTRVQPITSAEAEKERPADAQSEMDIAAINANILSLADLINNPLPNRKMEDIIGTDE